MIGRSAKDEGWEVGVEYRLLGPVEVYDGIRSIPLGGPRRRTVLALLALNVGQPLAIPRLIDAVWEGSPPATARQQILIAISALRRELGDAIVTATAGYQLRAERSAIDLYVFEQAVAAARGGSAAGRRAAGLRDALRLWRGPALAGVSGLESEAARLEELRLSVLEECLETELHLGAHGERVAELSGLVSEHPVRERLRGLLMLALFRSGRQADALECYRIGRERLVDELGIEPAQPLRQLHQLILTGDPALDPPAAVHRLAHAPGQAPGRAHAHAPPAFAQQVPGPAWQQDPPQPVDPRLFGVTVNDPSGAMPAFRVGAVRLWDCDCRWANLEPYKGEYLWSTLDRLVDGAEERGLPAVYTMGMPPEWAASGEGRRGPYPDGSRAAPPRDLTDWETYVGAVAGRYRGRGEASELWDNANSAFRYSGSSKSLAELVQRAAAVLRSADPAATIVAPSFCELWEPAARQAMGDFALAGGYDECDVVAVKLSPREVLGVPEEAVELAELIDQTLHEAGVSLPIWSMGASPYVVPAPRLTEELANAYAVRHFLVGLYVRYERAYFYNWGSRKLPLVLQAAGGPPTRAAHFVHELQQWLEGAYVRACGTGADVGLPTNVWQVRIAFPRGAGSWAEAAIRWTSSGEAMVPAEPEMERVESLDGESSAVPAGGMLRITELPVLIRYGVPPRS